METSYLTEFIAFCPCLSHWLPSLCDKCTPFTRPLSHMYCCCMLTVLISRVGSVSSDCCTPCSRSFQGYDQGMPPMPLGSADETQVHSRAAFGDLVSPPPAAPGAWYCLLCLESPSHPVSAYLISSQSSPKPTLTVSILSGCSLPYPSYLCLCQKAAGELCSTFLLFVQPP
jgi:hypothetical protein